MVLSPRWLVSDAELRQKVEAAQQGGYRLGMELREPARGPVKLNRSPQIGLKVDQDKLDDVRLDVNGLPVWNNNTRASMKHDGGFDAMKSSSTKGTARSSSFRGTHTGAFKTAGAATMTPRKARHSGQPINIEKMRKDDTLPCPVSGRRSVGAASEIIRLYIYLPTTQDQICFMVHPDMPVGPDVVQESNGVGMSSDSVTPSFATGHKTKTLSQYSESESPSATSPRITWRRKVYEESNVPSESPEKNETTLAGHLQELIEAYTGIPVMYQKLWCGSRVVHPCNTLREQGINHGDTVSVNMGDVDVAIVKKKLHDMARANCAKKKCWVMPRWEHQATPRLIGEESFEMRLGNEVYFHDYRPLRDVGSIDPCGLMRSQFGNMRH